MITVGTDATRSRAAIAIAAAPRRRVGHRRAAPARRERRRRHDRAARSTSLSVVAVGECGLDYHYDHSPRDVQRERVRRAGRARARARPAARHPHPRGVGRHVRHPRRPRACRRAHRVPLLHGRRRTRRGACLDLGAFLSFSGIVTFPKAADVRDGGRAVPARSPAGRDRLRRTSRPFPIEASPTSRRSCLSSVPRSPR